MDKFQESTAEQSGGSSSITESIMDEKMFAPIDKAVLIDQKDGMMAVA